MNTLHWHLTEDQGWRIEIDKYPKLNSIASSRIKPNGDIYKGIYTKEDIREIVEYALKKNITIIPEIELPGHSQAVIAAYPALSCNKEKIPVANDWGVFKEIYCAGNEDVFMFLEDVFTEVIELFPSKYTYWWR
jgi:hexosaminidase